MFDICPLSDFRLRKKYLSVLTCLSVFICTDEQVDSLYLHHPKSRVDISQESRLKLTSQEVAEWKQELGTCLVMGLSDSLSSLDWSLKCMLHCFVCNDVVA